MRGASHEFSTSALLTYCALVACKGDRGAGPDTPPPAALIVIQGDSQSGSVGTALQDSIIVLVTSSQNTPVAAAISFQVTSGGGTVSPQTVMAQADGRASAQWTLGLTLGRQTSSAKVRDWSSVPPASFRATANPGEVDLVTVAPESTSVVEAKSLQLSAKVQDKYGNPIGSATIAWVSDSPLIATVSPSGLVKGVAPGFARVTATSGGRSGAARIVVVKGIVATVVVSPSQTSISVRDSARLTAVAHDAEGEVLHRTATWTASDQTIAAVSSDGTVIAAQPGTTSVRATIEGKVDSSIVTVRPLSLSTPAQQSLQALATIMDRCHLTFPVYTDVSSPCSHFVAFGKIPSAAAPVAVYGSEESTKHSGATSIRFSLTSTDRSQYGGYYLLAGVLPRDAVAPIPDFGTTPNAGYDLTGATELTFWARGAGGGEVVDFFVGGVGRNPANNEPYPDSPYPESATVSKITQTLSASWRQYNIPLAGKDLSYVLSGFGWSAAVANNPNGATFFVDDIEFRLSPAAMARRLAEPRFLTSFVTLPRQPDPFDNVSRGDLDFVLRNTAFSYDNALALLAFLAAGNADGLRRAELVGRAFVYAMEHDRRFEDGRVRSAYASGDLRVPPAWTPNGKVGTVAVPGYYIDSERKFYEVEQHATDVGNNAWVMIGLLALHRRTGSPEYLSAARRTGDFIERFRVSSGLFQGYRGGEDFPESTEIGPRSWASSEHNLDVFAAFSTMHGITREDAWSAGAAHAQSFVEAMWDTSRECFLAGTDNPTVRNERERQLPLDVQAWNVLARRDALVAHPNLLACPEGYHRVSSDGFVGFDFNDDKDGVWFEGTAQMAVAYTLATQPTKAEQLLAELRRAQSMAHSDLPGGLWAASKDGVSTGFDVVTSPTTSVPFELFRRVHVGATAWNVFAQQGMNPYYLAPR